MGHKGFVAIFIIFIVLFEFFLLSMKSSLILVRYIVFENRTKKISLT